MDAEGLPDIGTHPDQVAALSVLPVPKLIGHELGRDRAVDVTRGQEVEARERDFRAKGEGPLLAQPDL